MREIKIENEEKVKKRNRRLRRAISAVVIAGVIVLIVVLVSGSNPPKKTAADKSTTTTTALSSTTTTAAAASSTSTTVAGTPVTAAVSHTAVAPVCPPTTAAGAAKRVIDFTTAPPICIISTDTYDATVVTDVGTFVIQMKPSESPAAVNNFVFLARYHFYDDVVFHRVIPGFVVQGGDPTGTGTGGPGYSFTGNAPASSCTAAKDCYPLGAVAMANSGSLSSNGSQFFIVVGAEGEQLPASYSLFGQVISGMSVVQKIAADGTASGVPPKVLHHMIKVTITQTA